MTRNPNAKSFKLLLAALALVAAESACATPAAPGSLKLNDDGKAPASPNTFRG